jgi:2,3-bisphosphoglycerate-dependent phosphoglycerate mutase
MNSRAQIIATVGTSSENPDILKKMILSGMDVVRFNFSWGDFTEKKSHIDLIRKVGLELNKNIEIIADIPGPRIQNGKTHTYDTTVDSALTENDKEIIKFCVGEKIDFIAMSFVGKAQDVFSCKEFIGSLGGSQKVIAKIERKVAVENIDEIIRASDAIMIARGDLGNEIMIEELPFVQSEIIKKCKSFNKPVIVATQMLLSMTENTRAEVTDVSVAITEGADAVMLSEETAIGKNPVESVQVMERIIKESEHHLSSNFVINPLSTGEGHKKTTGKLVLVRHQESEWNKLGQWTGSRDVHLTPKGFEESEQIGAMLQDICFDQAFASMQVRTIETLSSILSVCNAKGSLPTEHASALNERDYGDYTGKNKWDMEKIIGEEEFNNLRRSWDYPVPNGETLKMVYERATPFYLERILPILQDGKNVLVVSHGNTIRALMKYIEKISDEGISDVEMLFSDVVLYDIDRDGHMLKKEKRSLDTYNK